MSKVILFQNTDGSVAALYPGEPMIQTETPIEFMGRMAPTVPPIQAEKLQEYLARVEPLAPIVVGETQAEYIARVEPQAPRKPAETATQYYARVSPTIPEQAGETLDQYIARVTPLVPMIPEETDYQYVARVSQLIPMKTGETLDQYLARVTPTYPMIQAETPDEYVTRVSPQHPLIQAETEQQYLDRIASKDLPAGVTRLPDADITALPDFTHQECWRYVNGAITIDLGLYKTEKKDWINAQRNQAIAVGQDISYNGNIYDGDAPAQNNVNAALNNCKAAGATPSGFTWRTKDNKDIPFSLTDLENLASLMFQFGDSQYSKSWNLKAQIDAVGTEPAWVASSTYAAGNAIQMNGYRYTCTTAGTSGATTPTFPTTANATVTDGSAVWECQGTLVQYVAGITW